VGERVELPDPTFSQPIGGEREGGARAASDEVEAAEAPPGASTPPPLEGLSGSERALARQADEAFERYLQLQSERRFSEAARELERLGEILEELAGEDSPPEP
jgi:hypothetical protein